MAVNSAKSNFSISASKFYFADIAMIIFICAWLHLLRKNNIRHEIKKNGEFCLCISQSLRLLWTLLLKESKTSLLPSPAVTQLHLFCMCVKVKLSQSCLTLYDSSVNLYVNLLPKPQIPLLPKHRCREQTYGYQGGNVVGRSGLEDWDWYVYTLCIN